MNIRGLGGIQWKRFGTGQWEGDNDQQGGEKDE